MPNIVEEQDSTIRQKIDNKTELLSVTTGDVGRSIYDSFILAALFSETIIGKTYPKGWPARDVAFNLYIAKLDNVSSDVNNTTNWQLVGSGANKQVWDLAMDSFPSDAYEVTNPSITAYKTDDIYIATPDVPNTGTCTAEINSLGALPIKKASGSSYVDLFAGDFSATSYLLYRVTYFLLVGGVGGDSSTPFTETIIGDGNPSNDTRIVVHGKNTATPSVQLWYEYSTGQWRQLDVTQGITTETATPNQLLLNLLAYEGNQTSNKYSIIVQ